MERYHKASKFSCKEECFVEIQIGSWQLYKSPYKAGKECCRVLHWILDRMLLKSMNNERPNPRITKKHMKGWKYECGIQHFAASAIYVCIQSVQEERGYMSPGDLGAASNSFTWQLICTHVSVRNARWLYCYVDQRVWIPNLNMNKVKA